MASELHEEINLCYQEFLKEYRSIQESIHLGTDTSIGF